MKKLLAGFLCICMLAILIPTAALTLASYSVYINGTEFTAGALTMTCGKGTATLDVTTTPYTLTLADATMQNIRSTVPLKIVLRGASFVSDTTNYGVHLTSSEGGSTIEAAADAMDSTLLIVSTGTALSLWGGDNALTLLSGTVDCRGGDSFFGLYDNNGDAPVTVSGGTLSVYGGSKAVSSAVSYPASATVTAGESIEQLDAWDPKTSPAMTTYKCICISVAKKMTLGGSAPAPLSVNYTTAPTLTVTGAPAGATYLWVEGTEMDKEKLIAGAERASYTVPKGLAEGKHVYTVFVFAPDYTDEKRSFAVIVGAFELPDVTFDADSVSGAVVNLEDGRLVVSVTSKANDTQNAVVYFDEQSQTVKKATESTPNKFIVPDITVDSVAALSATENGNSAPAILRKTDDAVFAASLINNQVLITEARPIITTDSFYSFSGKQYNVDPSVLADIQEFMANYIPPDNAGNAKLSLNIPLAEDKLAATQALRDSLNTALSNATLVMPNTDAMINLNADVNLNIQESKITIPTDVVDTLANQVQADVSLTLENDVANIRLSNDAIDSLAEQSKNKSAVKIEASGFDTAAVDDLKALAPNATVWDAHYLKVADVDGNPYQLPKDVNLQFDVKLPSTIPEPFLPTLIAAKGSTTDGDTTLVTTVPLTKIKMPDGFYYKDGAWCVDEPDGYILDNTYYVKNRKIYTGLLSSDGTYISNGITAYPYFCQESGKNYGKRVAKLLHYSPPISMGPSLWIVMDEAEPKLSEWLIDGKIYVRKSPGDIHLVEKPSDSPRIISLFDTTSSPVGLLSESWLDYADTSWYNETDTAFKIDTPEALAGVAKLSKNGNSFSGKSIRLTSDVDLSAHVWTPIENFGGSFYGSGTTISNMLSTGRHAALFNQTNGATICNFTITGEARGTSNAAGVVCTADNTALYNIDNTCTVWTNDVAGGICAFGNNVTVQNCANNGTITAEQTNPPSSSLCAGGIVGRCIGVSVFENLVNYGAVSGGTEGSIIGEDSATTTVKNCYYITATPLIGYKRSTPLDSDYYNPLSGIIGAGVTVNVPSGTDNALSTLDKDTANAWVDAKDASKFSQWKNGRDDLPFLDFRFLPYATWAEAAEAAVLDTDYVLGNDFCIIKSEKGLAHMAQEVNAGSYDYAVTYLAKDLDLSGLAWTPIGTDSNAFRTVFDGLGHVIKGVTVSDPDASCVGLFGTLAPTGVICNLGVLDCKLTAQGTVGGIAAVNSGKITNCFSSVKINANVQAGGIAGMTHANAVTNCYSYGTINCNMVAAGLVGDCCAALNHSYAQTGMVSQATTDIRIAPSIFDAYGAIAAVSPTTGGCENIKTVGCGTFEKPTKTITLADDYTFAGSLGTKTTTYADNGTTLIDALNAWVAANSAQYDYGTWVTDPKTGYPVFAASYPVLLDSEHCTLLPEDGSAAPVAPGDSYSFKLAIEDGYKASSRLAVTVNGTELTDNTGVYTIADIRDIQIVTVSGIQQKAAASTPMLPTFTVVFNTDGGTAVKNQGVVRNRTVAEPTAPTKAGFTFGGWYTDKACTKAYNFSATVKQSLILYAKWTEGDNSIVLTIGNKKAVVFGKTVANDVAPLIRNDRTMLPARFVAENLGAKVAWDEAARKVTITKGDVTIEIFIDSDKAYVNNKKVTLDSPAFIENDRTYTPVRFISEQLGAKVDWVEADQAVIITK